MSHVHPCPHHRRRTNLACRSWTEPHVLPDSLCPSPGTLTKPSPTRHVTFQNELAMMYSAWHATRKAAARSVSKCATGYSSSKRADTTFFRSFGSTFGIRAMCGLLGVFCDSKSYGFLVAVSACDGANKILLEQLGLVASRPEAGRRWATWSSEQSGVATANPRRIRGR